MANPTYVNSNLLHMFYKTGTDWEYFGYIQSNGLSLSNSFTEISSKQHGIHPDQTLSASNWTMSQSAYVTPENANTAIGWAMSGTKVKWCFCKVAQDEQVAKDGLSGVTGYGSVEEYTIGTDFKRYGEGYISSASITSNANEIATIDIEIQGIGALSETAPV